jgi:hypothetical protein
MPYSQKTLRSAHAGLSYRVHRYPGSSGFVVVHDRSGFPVVDVHDAARAATDFPRWADEALSGVDWTRDARDLAADPATERAVSRFRRGLAWLESAGRQRVEVDRDFAHPDAGEPFGHGHPLVGQRMRRR